MRFRVVLIAALLGSAAISAHAAGPYTDPIQHGSCVAEGSWSHIESADAPSGSMKMSLRVVSALGGLQPGTGFCGSTAGMTSVSSLAQPSQQAQVTVRLHVAGASLVRKNTIVGPVLPADRYPTSLVVLVRSTAASCSCIATSQSVLVADGGTLSLTNQDVQVIVPLAGTLSGEVRTQVSLIGLARIDHDAGTGRQIPDAGSVQLEGDVTLTDVSIA